jgi:hypothetical protein
MQKYAVVEFVATEDVDIVPTNWIFSENGQQLCYWPPFPTLKCSRLVQKCVPADASWTAFEIRQLFSTGLLCLRCYIMKISFKTSC